MRILSLSGTLLLLLLVACGRNTDGQVNQVPSTGTPTLVIDSLVATQTATRAMLSLTPSLPVDEAVSTSVKNPPTMTSVPPTSIQTLMPSQTSTPTLTETPDNTVDKAFIAEMVASAWQNNVSVDEVKTTLVNQGWLFRDDEIATQLWQETRSPFMVTDLNNDGESEWFVSIRYPGELGSCAFEAQGELWIINGSGIVFSLTTPNDSVYWNVPIVVAQDDVTGDGLPDIVTQSVGCGAHTNVSSYHVISFHHGSMSSIISRESPLETLSSPYRPDVTTSNSEGWSAIGTTISSAMLSVEDLSGDGIQDLVLSGGTFNSAGAGYHRRRHELWSWDGSSISLTHLTWENTGERYHRLIDGNFLFDTGNLIDSVAIYEEVIQNDDLTNETFFYHSVEEAENRLRQFAAFRLVLTLLLLDNSPVAENWMAWLESNFPEAPLTEAAALLWERWSTAGDLSLACDAVTSYLNELDNPLFPIDYTGYGNPVLEVDSICVLRISVESP